MSGEEVTVTKATPEDACAIMGMIRELAEFEKMPEGVEIDEKQVATDIEREAVLGLLLRVDGQPAAMVLYYYGYSTWQGRFIHMEDLYVRPQWRRKGFGKKLWVELGKIASEMGCKRLQWNVLDWNENAIKFYKTMPIKDLTANEGWLLYRLEPEGIAQLAKSLD